MDGENMDIELYRWQRECLDVWEANGRTGIINVITGAGKTVFAMAGIQNVFNMMSRLGDEPIPYESVPLQVMIVVPTVPLATQWGSVLRRWFPQLTRGVNSLGFYYGAQKSKSECRFMVYVINSARYALARHAHQAIEQGKRVLLIADECHHYASPENRKIFDFITMLPDRRNCLYTMGLSATPQNINYEAVLVPALGPQIFEYSFKEALRDNRITPFALLQIAVTFTAEENAQYQDYSNRILRLWTNLVQVYPEMKGMDFPRIQQFLYGIIDRKEDRWEEADTYLRLLFLRAGITRTAKARISCAIDLSRRLPGNVRILVFCERIEQADKVYEAFRVDFGKAVNRYHSRMDKTERQRVLNAFKDGEIRILISCRALDEGLDVPDASIGIVLASTSTARQRIQRLGRILRKSEEKPLAALYYIYVRGSGDLTQYLPESGPAQITNLRYLLDENTYIHEKYETLAVLVLDDRIAAGATEEQVTEIRQCIDEGLLLSDWMMKPSEYAPIIAGAKGKHARNYWLVMKKIAEKADEFSSWIPEPELVRNTAESINAGTPSLEDDSMDDAD